MKYWDDGFYLEQNKENTRYEISDEYWNELLLEQNKGKEIKITNGKLIAIEHQPTQKELLDKELADLLSWFEEYDNQVKQYERSQRMGEEFDKDINVLDLQAKENAKRISEIRNILKGGE